LRLDLVKTYIAALADMPAGQDEARKILSLIDLTSLNDTDTVESITSLCAKALTLQHPHVAAICVYPRFVEVSAKKLIGSEIKIATVVNFPYGTDGLDATAETLLLALRQGAKEIDVVLPYQRFLTGGKSYAKYFIQQCKAMCNENALLKVILETGVMQDMQLIAEASELSIAAGADFLKTSTGKVAIGASLEAAAVMLLTIKESGKPVGLKVSGGIKTLSQAQQYLHLANQIMGPAWATPATLRFGASQLLDQLINV
jgi:deoxyribose-phosphate aldolase